MNKSVNNGTSQLKIFEDVICKIAETAALDVNGVCGFAKRKVDFAHLFVSSESQSAIDVRTDGESVEITLGIKVSGGCKLNTVAEKVQKRVKDDVQNMTGIAVTKVNVFVYDIVFDAE